MLEIKQRVPLSLARPLLGLAGSTVVVAKEEEEAGRTGRMASRRRHV